MGFDDGRIILDSENGAYYAGQTVYGRIVFDQGKPKTIHGIYVSCKGFCKVHWTTTTTRHVDGRTVHDTHTHESYEEYFKRKIFIVGNSDGEHHLNQGHHEFRFDCPIPANCPSSFEGTYGHIRYSIKAVMVTTGMFSSNKEKKVAIRVHTPVDLNLNPYCKEPLEYELITSYCCWCVSAGSSEIRVKMPVAGYCPGQVIPMEVSVVNPSSVEIDEIKFAIKQDLSFEATCQAGTKNEHSTVAEIQKGPIPAGTTRNWTLEMSVPAMDVYNLNACRYINIEHYLKVSTEVSGCHEGSEDSHRIIIGDVPIVGFQDNVPNPLQDQMPKPTEVQNVQGGTFYPPQPIMNQPQPSYPNGGYPQNTPYPGGPPNVSPYPNQGNQPYPNVSPYPQNQPYPNSGSPYPGNNQPYPGNNQPYPSNTPYSMGNLPQPNPSPVPGYAGRSPSPLPPYPGNSPAPPYPGGSPNVTNASLVKSGDIGFTAPGGDPAAVPLLPPGSNVPYPPTPSSNPYATASAPEPSTPGSDLKKPPLDPPEVTAPYPAYNPDFVKDDKKDEKHN